MIFGFAGGTALLAVVLAWVIAARRPNWRTFKIVLIASAPGPLAISLFCVAWMAMLGIAPRACTYCDNPGMAMFALLMGLQRSDPLFVFHGDRAALLAWLTVATLRS